MIGGGGGGFGGCVGIIIAAVGLGGGHRCRGVAKGFGAESAIKRYLGSCRSEASLSDEGEGELHQLAELRTILWLEESCDAELVAIFLVDGLDAYLGIFIGLIVLS